MIFAGRDRKASSATVFVCLCHLGPVATVGHLMGQTLEGGWGDWEHAELREPHQETLLTLAMLELPSMVVSSGSSLPVHNFYK